MVVVITNNIDIILAIISIININITNILIVNNLYHLPITIFIWY